MASPRQRGMVPLVGKLPHQPAAELIPNPNPNPNLARALGLALGPRPSPNPKQAAELLPHKTLHKSPCSPSAAKFLPLRGADV